MICVWCKNPLARDDQGTRVTVNEPTRMINDWPICHPCTRRLNTAILGLKEGDSIIGRAFRDIL